MDLAPHEWILNDVEKRLLGSKVKNKVNRAARRLVGSSLGVVPYLAQFLFYFFQCVYSLRDVSRPPPLSPGSPSPTFSILHRRKHAVPGNIGLRPGGYARRQRDIRRERDRGAVRAKDNQGRGQAAAQRGQEKRLNGGGSPALILEVCRGCNIL